MLVGEALAEARGEAGLTVAEVSQRTRIRETIIREIEGDDYSACGGDFYARGNIRSIAKAVGADPEPLICEYDAIHRAPGVLSAVSLDELLTQSQTPEPRRLNWAAVLVCALLVALGFGGYMFFRGSPHSASTPPAAADHRGISAGHGVTHSGQSQTGLSQTGLSQTGLSQTRLDPRPGRVAPPFHLTAAAQEPVRPPAIVRAYIAAINGHHYARAWHIGGRNVGGTYSGFVTGFAGTARDTLTILSVSGNVVTARLDARQTDGTVDTYQGTYTVHHTVIIAFDVVQLS